MKLLGKTVFLQGPSLPWGSGFQSEGDMGRLKAVVPLVRPARLPVRPSRCLWARRGWFACSALCRTLPGALHPGSGASWALQSRGFLPSPGKKVFLPPAEIDFQ